MRIPSEGVFNAYLLDRQGGYTQITNSEITDAEIGNRIVWLDLDYTNPEVQGWLKLDNGLKHLICETLIAETTRPRVIAVDDGLLLILRGVNLNPGADPDDMISIRFWVTEELIISTRMRNLFSIIDLKESFEVQNGPKTSAEFIVQLANFLVLRMTETIDNLEEVISQLEEEIFSSETADLRTDLSGLRRQIIELRRFMAPQRDALSQLPQEKSNWFNKNNLHLLHNVKERLIRHIEDLDAVRDRATIIQDELQTHLSNQLNKRMYILSLIAAIFLPLGFLTGLLGVNIGGIPGADYPFAFHIFIISMVVIVVIQIIIFRSRKWL